MRAVVQIQDALLVPVELSKLHERALLMAKLRLPLLHRYMFADWRCFVAC